jgi:indolepyruvate ferredoxin oxidoreductase beta subunit
MRKFRRGNRRHAIEVAHLDAWMSTALSYRAANYDLAVEVVRCRRLVKGYSDTHARGLSKFDQVIGTIPLIATRDDAADWTRRLREAALKDEFGKALDGAIATIKSFA